MADLVYNVWNVQKMVQKGQSWKCWLDIWQDIIMNKDNSLSCIYGQDNKLLRSSD